MSTYQTLELETHRDVSVIWMNRPEVRNAFNETMIAELSAAFQSLDGDDAVKAVVLAGRGKSFCAGADLNWMQKMSGYSAEENHRDALGLANMLHTRELLTELSRQDAERPDLRTLLRSPFFVPESKSVQKLLREFQQRRFQQLPAVRGGHGNQGVACL